MIRPIRGTTFLTISCVFLAGLMIAGCAPVLSQRQALIYATARLNRFCAESGPCESHQVSGAERLKQGWLIDFDASTTRYGVMVRDNRVTEISVWKKDVPAAPGG